MTEVVVASAMTKAQTVVIHSFQVKILELLSVRAYEAKIYGIDTSYGSVHETATLHVDGVTSIEIRLITRKV